MGSNSVWTRQGDAYKLYLVNTWNQHVSHMATKFISKKSIKGFYGDDMHLCRFYGRKYSPKEEFGHLQKVKEVGMHANEKDTC